MPSDLRSHTWCGYTPSDEIREDYITSYKGDKFAESIAYVQAYPAQLPLLMGGKAGLLRGADH